MKRRTVPSSPTSRLMGMGMGGWKAIRAWRTQFATTRPATPPRMPRIMVSVRSWRIRVHRRAPMASRRAISFFRSEARARRKPARLVQATSRTSPTTVRRRAATALRGPSTMGWMATSEVARRLKLRPFQASG